MSTIKVDTIATRTGSGNITVSNDTAFSTSVLVGKTSSNIATEGIELRANDDVMITQSGDTCLYLNRLSSDGSIVDLRKDGTTVGTVGANASRSFISGPQKGIKFGNASADPCTNAGAAADNSYDLGGSSIRYKDLYLSGGVLLGGTGAANKLDDYEEGTWTPALSSGDSSTYDGRSGHYTKIGRQVIATFKLEIGGTFAGGTTQYLVGGLPFTAVSGLTHSTGSGFLHYYENLRQNVTGVTMRIDNGQSVMYFSAYASANNGLDVNANILQAQSNIYGTVVYITA